MEITNEGFTLIELVVVMAIIAILVLLAAPRFLGYTKDANVTTVKQDTKVLTDASELYHIDNNEWPIVVDSQPVLVGVGGLTNVYPLDETKVKKSIKNIKGDYSDYGLAIDGKYAGQAFHLDGVEDKSGNIAHGNFKEFEIGPYYSDKKDWLEKIKNNENEYVLAKDSHFVKKEGEYSEASNSELIAIDYYQYTGDDEYIIIPEGINGDKLTNYAYMFDGTGVKGVASYNKNIKNMHGMFRNTTSDALDVSLLNTNGVKNMGRMFRNSKVKNIDVSHFDTSEVTTTWDMFMETEADTINMSGLDFSNVTYMRSMFHNSLVSDLLIEGLQTRDIENMHAMFMGTKNLKELDLSVFETSNTKVFNYLFYLSSIKVLDLSSFDTSNMTESIKMFYGSEATIGYARTLEDAARLNETSGKPTQLNFVVK